MVAMVAMASLTMEAEMSSPSNWIWWKCLNETPPAEQGIKDIIGRHFSGQGGCGRAATNSTEDYGVWNSLDSTTSDGSDHGLSGKPHRRSFWSYPLYKSVWCGSTDHSNPLVTHSSCVFYAVVFVIDVVVAAFVNLNGCFSTIGWKGIHGIGHTSIRACRCSRARWKCFSSISVPPWVENQKLLLQEWYHFQQEEVCPYQLCQIHIWLA